MGSQPVTNYGTSQAITDTPPCNLQSFTSPLTGHPVSHSISLKIRGKDIQGSPGIRDLTSPIGISHKTKIFPVTRHIFCLYEFCGHAVLFVEYKQTEDFHKDQHLFVSFSGTVSWWVVPHQICIHWVWDSLPLPSEEAFHQITNIFCGNSVQSLHPWSASW